MSAPVENLAQRLNAKRSGKGWIAKCPAHDDREPSLSINEGADGRALLKCHAGCATNDVLAALGMTPRDLFQVKYPQPNENGAAVARAGQTTTRKEESKQSFDWQRCVSALKAKDLVRLGNERWYSRAFCSWLHEKKLVGLYNGNFAFPVGNGAVIGTHYCLEDGSWRYTPTGTKTAPLVIGDLAKAKQVHLCESQWDLLALADRTDLYRNEYHAFIATRGASNVALLKGLLPTGASVLAWPQNDAAGQNWLSDLGAHTGTALAKAVTPAPYKDVNDWTKAGASAEELYRPLWRNEVVYEPPKPFTTVDLASLLNAIVAFLQRYIVFQNPEQPVAIALWVVHTWVLDAFTYSPYLHIASPEKQCGKTRLLDCLELLAAKPWRAILPSEAVLFRKIDVDRPALLLDEVDAIFTNGKDDRKEPLRALLNNGFSRSATVPRCVGPNFQIQDFQVFCAKALAGIGKLPDTVRDRSVPIQLVRRSRDEKVERFRKREAEKEAMSIRSELEAWSQKTSNIDTLRDARPSVPDELSDRQADICEPLLAITDLASGEWPERARGALIKLCCQSDEDESTGVKLLSHIRDVFNETQTDRLSTKEILEALVALETDAPWAEWWEQDLKNENIKSAGAKLARKLKRYGIKAKPFWVSGETARGYFREEFEQVWKRFCPCSGERDVRM